MPPRIEHGLKIEGGAADDLEHIGGGGLLLQGFAQFIQQPHVLDGDDSLICEVLDQFDLLVGEGTDFLAIDDYCTDKLTILKHRHNK